MNEPTATDDGIPAADHTPSSSDDAGILARFLGRTLTVPGDVARAATRGTLAVFGSDERHQGDHPDP